MEKMRGVRWFGGSALLAVTLAAHGAWALELDTVVARVSATLDQIDTFRTGATIYECG